jgi:hypothetical protein
MDTLYDVVGYEGRYKINKNGEIWSSRYKRFLKPHYNNCGYLKVSLGRNNSYLIHRLLALQFIPNPDNFDMIDHIDRNKINNNLENLRWCNRATNEQNTTRHKDNIVGFKHIDAHTRKHRSGNTSEYWRIRITTEKLKCKFEYSKSKYTLEQVVEFRNKIYIENNIQKYD